MRLWSTAIIQAKLFWEKLYIIGDVTEVDVYSHWRALYKSHKRWTNGYFIKMDLQELVFQQQ